MKCWKCMADIPEDGRFCPVCGADVNGETETPEAEAAESGGNEEEPKPGKGKGFLPLLAWCAAAVILIAGVVFYMNSRPAETGENSLFYIKDQDFYRIDIAKSQRMPEKCSDMFSDNQYEDEFESGFITDIYGVSQYISKDGKILYYPEDMDTSSSEFTLYCQEQGKDRVKIDRNVWSYEVTDDNKVIYQKNVNSLYLFDGTDRKKLSSDAKRYIVDDTGKYVIWTSPSDEEYEEYDEEYTEKIFCRDLALAEEKKELESSGELIDVSEDFSRILIKKKNSLYLIENFGEPVKLVEDADTVKSVDLKQMTFYFAKEAESHLMMMDYVEDDLEASDANALEPLKDDYIIEDEEDAKDETAEEDEYDWLDWGTENLSDEYYEKLTAYEQKQERDTIRDQLEDEPANFYKELYFYKDGEVKLVDPQWQAFSWQMGEDEKGYVRYYRNPDVSVKKVKISEMSDAEDAKFLIQDANVALNPQEMIASGEKTVRATVEGFDEISDGITSEDGQIIYFLASPGETEWDAENVYKLYSIKLDAENFGQITEIDSDVDTLECASGTDVYYVKNARNYQGDLYKNGDLLLKNVNEYTIGLIPDSTSITCISDVDQDKNWGTVNVIKDGTVNAIADRVTYCDVIGETNMILLRDYSEDKVRGKLAYYDGEQVQDLAEDVFGFIPRGAELQCFSLSW